MLRDVAAKYYFDGDHNCAESVLLAANEVYGFGLDEKTCFRMVSAFGGGLGCGLLCGAAAGAMAALGQAAVETRAHATPGFKELCAQTAKELEEALGDMNCSVLRPKFFTKENRCYETVCRAADMIEKRIDALRNA